VLVDSSVVQGLTGGQPEYLYALHVNSDDVDAALQPVRNAAPAAEVISVADLIAEVSALLNNIVLLLEAMASLSMLAGLIIIANTVTLAMIERRREMGILKSVGYTSRSVLGQVLCENGVAAFLAGSLAMVFVVVAMILLEHFLFNFPGFRGAGVSESIILGLIAAVTAVSLLVAASVAWAATRVRPMEVLRYE
jgi:putative ABC transport system permease protein